MIPPSNGVDRKTHIAITGGTKGIGLAAAEALAPLARKMVLTYHSDRRSAEQARDRVAAAGASSLEVELMDLDITATDSADRLCKRLSESGCRPDVVIFNAGVTLRAPLAEIDSEAWKRVFDGNVHFPVSVVQRLAPRMKAGGVFLFTGSMMALHPHSVSLAYGVTKSAVHALVRNLVKELAPYGHRVAGIAPGFVDTDWQIEKPAEIRKSIESKIALHRFAKPQEVGEVFRMVVENGYFNGDIITLSGGYNYK